MGVPIIRTIVFWGLYWGTLILGNYHSRLALQCTAFGVRRVRSHWREQGLCSPAGETEGVMLLPVGPCPRDTSGFMMFFLLKSQEYVSAAHLMNPEATVSRCGKALMVKLQSC